MANNNDEIRAEDLGTGDNPPVKPVVDQEELKKRVEAFMTDYKALVDKYLIDFATYPVWLPDGAGSFKTTIQNTPVDITATRTPFINNG